MKYIRLKTHNPYYNLALEEYLFRNADDDIFMLWQNSPSVIVGRNQNAYAEVDLAYTEREGVNVCRRITGGGALSPLWSSIKSDVTGKTLKSLTESETACLGTALIAAVGIGDFPDIKTAVGSAVKIKKEYTPSGADYTDAYKNYCELDKLMNK